jgi:hypothetical protein
MEMFPLCSLTFKTSKNCPLLHRHDHTATVLKLLYKSSYILQNHSFRTTWICSTYNFIAAVFAYFLSGFYVLEPRLRLHH